MSDYQHHINYISNLTGLHHTYWWTNMNNTSIIIKLDNSKCVFQFKSKMDNVKLLYYKLKTSRLSFEVKVQDIVYHKAQIRNDKIDSILND
jgi:hypothetical protein